MKITVTALIAAAAVLGLASVCFAQDGDTTGGPMSAGIIVTGHADIQFPPDIAYADISIVTQARGQKDAAGQNARTATNVTAALIKAGVAAKDIATQDYSIQPQYDYNSGKSSLTGYQVSNSLHVTIRDLTRAGVIVDSATQAGANQVSGIDYELQDRSGSEGEVLAQAIASARSKADLMAGAAGVRLGRLITLTDNAVQAPRPIPIFNRMMAPAAEAPQPTTPLTPQAIDITADATAVYAIDYANK